MKEYLECGNPEGFSNILKLQVRILSSPGYTGMASFCSRLVFQDGYKFVDEKAVERLDLLIPQYTVCAPQRTADPFRQPVLEVIIVWFLFKVWYRRGVLELVTDYAHHQENWYSVCSFRW